MIICAPFAGTVRYHVRVGEHVAAGQVIATVEATKLEAPVVVPGPGIVAELSQEDYASVYGGDALANIGDCLLYTSPSPRDLSTSRMPSSA